MSDPITFAAAHARTAIGNPDAPAIVFPDQQLGHDQIRRLGLAFAARMQAAGVGPGSRVQLRTPDPVLVLAVLLGASWTGSEVFPFAGDNARPASLPLSHVFYDPRVKAEPVPGAIVIDESWSPASAPAFDTSTPVDTDLPWLWVHTSGTTGLPKFLSLSQRMVIARSLAVADEFRPQSRHVLLAQCYSRPFLARAAAALLNGSTLYFGLKPQNWHGAGIDMVSGSRGLIKTALNGAVLSPRAKRVELAGSRLPDHEAVALLDSFDIVDDTYGASETSKSYSTLWSLGADGTPVATGKMRDSEIQVIDADGTPVAPGERGIVRVRNPYMVAGYLNDTSASAEAFRDGWFYPGDVALVEADGRLRFADRADHVVNILGNKVNAFAVDQVLRTAAGVQDAICFRNPKPDAADELFAFVVLEESTNRLQAVASARHAVSERFGEYAVPRVIQPVRAIPRRADGAPDRAACAEMVLRAASARPSDTQP
jgi:acyl-coenzyme A synthetase/AMP-(fatty) acid ligase